jgi:murein DD-endopeptidase MepM/ murein hydrolase activator NlpD
MANFFALLRYLLGKMLLRKYLVFYGVVVFALGFVTAQTVATTRHLAREFPAERTTRTAETTAQKTPQKNPFIVQAVAPETTVPEKQSVLAIKTPVVEDGPQKVQLVVERGDTLIGVLTKAGVDDKEAYQAANALKKIYDMRSINVGQEIYASFAEKEDTGDLDFVSLTIEKPDHRVVVKKGDKGEFAAKKEEKKLEKQISRAGGMISTSLFQLAGALEVPSSVMQQAVKAYSYDVDFQRDIKNGNHFEVIYEIYTDENGQYVREGEMLFASLTVNGEELKIIRHTTPDGDTDYYTEDGHSVRKALLRTPISGARISSGFGMRRHPVLGYSRMHKGVDFAVPRGTPVYAAGDGVVDQVGKKGGYGNYLRIRHTSEYVTAYAHLHKYSSGIKKGRKVKQGQVVAYSGNTGVSTGPHLHYEVIVAGRQVNPSKVKMTPGRKLNKKELAGFNEAKKKMIALRTSLPMREQVASSN